MDNISSFVYCTQFSSFVLAIPEKINEKIDRIATRLAFGNQLDRLNEIEKEAALNKNKFAKGNFAKDNLAQGNFIKLRQDPEHLAQMLHAQMINPNKVVFVDKKEEGNEDIHLQSSDAKNDDIVEIVRLKRESLLEHIKTVSFSEKISLSLKLLVSKINLIRNLIMRQLIHPSASIKRYENLQNHYPITVGESVTLYSKDHQQLDARIFRGGVSDETRPIFVMCPGNGMSYEDWLDRAQQIASDNNVDVLLYNPRGVGLSLGELHNTDEDVEDCKAAINYALDLCQDPSQVGVLGFSLGGGITATALKELLNEGKFTEIGLYVNVNSFSSLQGFIKGQTGIPLIIGRIALWILGINPLNAGDALIQNKLASRTVVITAENDDLMKGIGRLSDYLNESRPLNLQVDCVNDTEDNSIALDDTSADEIAFYKIPQGHHLECPWNVIDRHVQASIGAA